MAAVHIPQRTREGVQAPPHAGFRLPNPFGRKIFSENQKKKKVLAVVHRVREGGIGRWGVLGGWSCGNRGSAAYVSSLL